jgi:hypothetical protein
MSVWTPEEDRLLRSMATAGESTAAIGRLLKRTTSSVRKRARLLKIKTARSPPGPKVKRRVDSSKQTEYAAQPFGGTEQPKGK